MKKPRYRICEEYITGVIPEEYKGDALHDHAKTQDVQASIKVEWQEQLACHIEDSKPFSNHHARKQVCVLLFSGSSGEKAQQHCEIPERLCPLVIQLVPDNAPQLQDTCVSLRWVHEG